MIYLRKFVRNKFLNTKQFPAGLFHRIYTIIPLNIYGKPSKLEESHVKAKNLLMSPYVKVPYNKFLSSVIKSVIPFPSNSHFHLITLYKRHL